MPLPSFITNLFTSGGSKLIETISNTVDEFTLSNEEKEAIKIKLIEATNTHIHSMEQEATKQMAIEQLEMDSARKREIDIANSAQAPLLNKIITPVLALLVLGSTFIFWYIIIFKDLNPQKEILISGIIGSLTTISMGVIGYYFGSSIGSKDKQTQLDKLK